ncbi:two-component system response regulator [Betaproteobacteria bacterium]|nr:two-component system response regulator [Betaproteobacteria bacterium]
MTQQTNYRRYKVALVDDSDANLTAGRCILKDDYEIYPVRSGARLFELLKKISVDLILLDVDMPEMSGCETLQLLKKDTNLANIPVIFLTAMSGEQDELEGLALGAVDYINKPFCAPLLKTRISNHILIAEQSKKLEYYNHFLKDEIDNKTQQVLNLQDTMLHAVSELVEFRDGNTGWHIYRTQGYLKLLVEESRRAGIYQEEMRDWDTELLVASAPLHDVGKIAISDAILNKPGKLDKDEFRIMKLHVNYGVEAIKNIEYFSKEARFLDFAKTIAASHHERWDGLGYPFGLTGNDIPLEGRMMAIADVYDALISVRPYKRAFSTAEAEQIINEGSGSHFDNRLIEVFNRVAPQFAAIARSTEAANLQSKTGAGVCHITTEHMPVAC